MQVRQVSLTNYRNYRQTQLELCPGKNILIGDNAQGKSNFLEAIEVASRGKSQRTADDSELIAFSQGKMNLTIDYVRAGFPESIAFTLTRAGFATSNRLEKKVLINGVKPPSQKALFGKLTTVTFSTQDLSMLRDGPAFRRLWIDTILASLSVTYQETLANYQKVVAQRNKLLKTLFEKGQFNVSEKDELTVWDKQLIQYGALIVKARLKLLHQLLPLAENYQTHLSGKREILTSSYLFKALADKLAPESDLKEIGQVMLTLLSQRLTEEIARKQTLIGPHRDDISFDLNNQSALSFASQGQQRSLVLALKLAELDLITQKLDEPPVLLLDDVLAELDVDRQGLLMSALNKDMQTIITTTHLSRFEPEWLSGANIYQVTAGAIEANSAIV